MNKSAYPHNYIGSSHRLIFSVLMVVLIGLPPMQGTSFYMTPIDNMAKWQPIVEAVELSFVVNSNIQIILTWETLDNLDLILETPSGSLIWRKNKTGIGVSMTRHSNDNVYTAQGLIDTMATLNSIVLPAVETISWLNDADYERGEYTVYVLFDDRRTCEKDTTNSTYAQVVTEITLNIDGDTYNKQLAFDDMLNDRCLDGYLSRYVYTKKSLQLALFTGKAKMAYKFFL
jgi:hypothetical protein